MIYRIIFDWKRTLYDPDHDELIEGAREVLELLKEKSIPLVLIGKGGKDMKLAVVKHKVKDYFDDIIFVGDEKSMKAFRPFILKKMPEATFVIGDRVRSELEIGNQLGATTIWVKQGKFADEKPLDEVQEPTITVASLSELRDFLAEK